MPPAAPAALSLRRQVQHRLLDTTPDRVYNEDIFESETEAHNGQ